MSDLSLGEVIRLTSFNTHFATGNVSSVSYGAPKTKVFVDAAMDRMGWVRK